MHSARQHTAGRREPSRWPSSETRQLDGGGVGGHGQGQGGQAGTHGLEGTQHHSGHRGALGLDGLGLLRHDDLSTDGLHGELWYVWVARGGRWVPNSAESPRLSSRCVPPVYIARQSCGAVRDPNSPLAEGRRRWARHPPTHPPRLANTGRARPTTPRFAEFALLHLLILTVQTLPGYPQNIPFSLLLPPPPPRYCWNLIE